ncbi:MAG: hypothetical protein SGCHY_005552, partial [Lobulomycetales sp.]
MLVGISLSLLVGIISVSLASAGLFPGGNGLRTTGRGKVLDTGHYPKEPEEKVFATAASIQQAENESNSEHEDEFSKAIAASLAISEQKDIHREGMYPVKPIDRFMDEREVFVLTQTKEGPCPLVALVNFLVLTGKMAFPKEDHIHQDDLLTFLGNSLETTDKYSHFNRVAVIEDMADWLNADPGFLSYELFNEEATPTKKYFEMFHVPLVHCWVLDPSKSYADTVLSYGESYETFAQFYLIRSELCRKKYPGIDDFDAYNDEMCRTEPGTEWFLNTKTKQCTQYGLEQIKSNLQGFAVLFK